MNGQKKPVINVQSTVKETDKSRAALESTQSFTDLVKNAGFVELDQSDTNELKSLGVLPHYFSAGHLTTALNLFSRGVTSKNLEKSTDQSTTLTDEEKKSFYGIAYLIQIFEEAPKDSELSQEFNLPQYTVIQEANLNPTVTFQEVAPDVTLPQPNQFLFQQSEGTLQPIIKEVVGKGIDVAKNKVKNYAVKAIKKVGGRLAKEALKKGAGLAIKAGVSAALKAVGVAIGGPIGLAINFAIKVGSFIVKKIKNFLGRIGNALFGPKNRRRTGGIALALGGGALILAGMPGLGLVSLAGGGLVFFGGTAVFGSFAALGLTAISAFASVAVPAIGAPIIVAIIATPVIIALILFIINSGAYVVPPAPSLVPGAYYSPYVDVIKEASPEGPFKNGQLPLTINYTITIVAKKETLNNIRFEYECRVIRSGSPIKCPDPSNVKVNGTGVDSSPFPPTPPSLISPVQNYVLTYSVTYNSSFRDSVVTDSLRVIADTEAVIDTESIGSVAVIFGNPPITCPLPGLRIEPRHGSYTPGKETLGHGSNDYWRRMGGRPCRWGLPQGVCYGPSQPSASSNVCYQDSKGACTFYGYAADVFAGPNAPVLAPTIAGRTVTWNCSFGWTNGGGRTGYTYICSSGGSKLILSHLNKNAKVGSLTSGQQIGSLFPQGSNTHVHIEYAIGGRYQRPEAHFCF